MLSCTAIIASFLFRANIRIEGNSVGGAELHIIDLGIRPKLRKNGANPVLTERAEFIANSMAGSFNTQSF
jgi:hypothetical protein